MIKHSANIVTGCRILGSVLLLLLPAFSVAFYILYILCGFSDMIDGTIARKTNHVSELGAKFDTVADLVFATVSSIKLLPILSIPGWLWGWIVAIAIIKIGSMIWGFVSEKQLIFLHTKMNKVTGLLLFLLPLTLSLIDLKYSSVAVCSIATVAAIQEGVCIAKNCENK